MHGERIEFLSAVQLVSRDADALADFYRDVLGLPLVEERDDADGRHWACALGDLHFSIRSVEGFEGADPPIAPVEEPDGPSIVGTGAIRLAFAVFDIDAVCESLEAHGLDLLYSPKDLGWCKVTAIRDPDGNYVELTELGDDWFRHLEKRKVEGHDLLLRYKKLEAYDKSDLKKS